MVITQKKIMRNLNASMQGFWVQMMKTDNYADMILKLLPSP
jgi:hypothetical protein